SENGILVKGSQYFEVLDKAEVLLTDKTGTLTTGNFKIKDIKIEEGYDPEEILDYLFNIENMTTHPIGRAIAKELDRKEKDLFEEIKNEKGLGVKAKTKDGRIIKVGSPKYHKIDDKEERAIYLSVDEKLAASVYIEDDIKEKSQETIAKLKDKFKEIAIVSGDNLAAVKDTADKL